MKIKDAGLKIKSETRGGEGGGGGYFMLKGFYEISVCVWGGGGVYTEFT